MAEMGGRTKWRWCCLDKLYSLLIYMAAVYDDKKDPSQTATRDQIFGQFTQETKKWKK